MQAHPSQISPFAHAPDMQSAHRSLSSHRLHYLNVSLSLLESQNAHFIHQHSLVTSRKTYGQSVW